MRLKQLLMLILMVGVAFSLSAQDASFYKKYAEKGDKEAMFNLAQCYINGNGGVEQDYNTATMWLAKSAKKNYAPAQTTLGLCYLYGAGVLKDYKQAWELFNKAYKQKDGEAAYYMAQMFKEGLFVQKSNAQYLRQLTDAAQLGSDAAEYELGHMYLYGNSDFNVGQDLQKGVNYIQSAANKNNAEALLDLGFCYREGVASIPQNLSKSFEYINKAAQTGSARAACEVGMSYLNGYGTEENPEEAFKYLSYAADQQIPNAYKMLGDMYYQGKGVNEDNSLAAQWYEKAVEAGYGPAYPRLANMYRLGLGVTQNFDKSFALDQAAAEAGYTEGNSGLGIAYLNGLGTAKNVNKAISNFKKAAEDGNNFSAYQLYRIYRDGEDISPDNQQALQYLRQAADGEYRDAIYSLGYEYGVGELLHQEDSKAIEYIKKAADMGDPFACGMIGTLYYSGDEDMNIRKNYDLAYKYLSYAATYPDGIVENLLSEVYKDLGACYRFGRGVEANHSMASYYTEKASELSSSQGDNSLKDVLELMRKD